MIRNPEIQFASADAIAAFQEERLREPVRGRLNLVREAHAIMRSVA